MTTTRQRVCILGATGSIGTSTLDVIARHPDRFEVFALTAHSRIDELFAQCVQWRPRYAVLPDAAQANELRRRLIEQGVRTEVLDGAQALCELAAHPEVDAVMAAIVGAAGLAPVPGRGARRQAPAARQQGSAGRRRQAVHGRGARRAAPRCCRSTASTRRSSSACPKTARPGRSASTTSCSPRRAARSAAATRPRSRPSRPTRPARTRTGRWAARSRSTRRR